MKLLLLWHMHQPTYRDYLSGQYNLPWVYLHTTKDYYEMPHLLEPYERVKVTFNVVPSLIEAIQDYATGEIQDEFLRHFQKSPEEMSEAEKQFLLDNFFFVNVERGIQPSARYTELYLKRGQRQRFSPAELRDLQVLFHLAWLGESFKREDQVIKHLVEKGRGFTEKDKRLLLGRMQWIFESTIKLYQSLWDHGRIELSTTPYYHPILPLLCDVGIARMSSPGTPLPETRFSYPDDARTQTAMALECFERVFGRRPKGFWPAEGSVSDEALTILSEFGGWWAATDEAILRQSKIQDGERMDPSLLAYRAYKFKAKGRGWETGDRGPETGRPSPVSGPHEIALFFRDHALSDLIGFDYQRWNAEEAVRDFMVRLRRIHERWPDAAVSVILDGENAWEGYPANGYDFLTLLYESLDKAEWIETTTFSAYLEKGPEMGHLHSIHPGSWIDANFYTWIGHEEKNRAWVYLKRAREAMNGQESSKIEDRESRIEDRKNALQSSILDPRAVMSGLDLARKSLLAAEGSDWFWWFGDTHFSAQDPVFDLIFRTHLKNVYIGLGVVPPSYLDTPVGIHMGALQRIPVAFMTPVIDGRDTNYFEWISAGVLSLESRGAMRRAAGLFSQLYFGFDRKNLYLRVDFKERASHVLSDLCLKIELYSALGTKVLEIGGSRESLPPSGVAVGSIVEAKISFDELKLSLGEPFDLILILKGDQEVERFPQSGTITLHLPREDFEVEHWMV